jgi:threonine/homoserine/homoserine lactone efflux protein
VTGLGVLRAFGLGFALGVVTGMPLAVINVAIVDAATAGRRRFASGLGLGGGAADTIHAGLAFAGVGRVVIANPALVRGLAIGAGVAIIAYAVGAWHRRERAGDPPVGSRMGPPANRPPNPPANPPANDDASVTRGLATGFALTLPNPGALAAWVAVAAAAWPDATPLEAALIAGGVGIGSALWFTTLARWVGRLHRDHPGAGPRSRKLELLPRVALVLLIAIAIAGVIRAL